jgi:hypothetical protein
MEKIPKSVFNGSAILLGIGGVIILLLVGGFLWRSLDRNEGWLTKVHLQQRVRPEGFDPFLGTRYLIAGMIAVAFSFILFVPALHSYHSYNNQIFHRAAAKNRHQVQTEMNSLITTESMLQKKYGHYGNLEAVTLARPTDPFLKSDSSSVGLATITQSNLTNQVTIYVPSFWFGYSITRTISSHSLSYPSELKSTTKT